MDEGEQAVESSSKRIRNQCREVSIDFAAKLILFAQDFKLQIAGLKFYPARLK